MLWPVDDGREETMLLTARHRDLKKVAIFLLVFGALVRITSVRAYAQVAGATMTGTVSDSSGAVVPNAHVAVQSIATSQVREVTTDDAGFYSVPNLLPGSYEVTVTAPGFSTQTRSGLTLTVGAEQQLNFRMQVGHVSQKVEETGDAPAVQLSSPVISGVVSQTAVVELPLNGRDW